MKLRLLKTAVLAGMLMLSAVVSTLLWARSDTPRVNNGPVLTDNEAKSLIATAKTPKEHRTLALYFNQQADRFEAEAGEHEGMIEAYRKTTDSVQTIEHCELAAKLDREMAKSLREMAAAHQEMAGKATKK